MHTVTASPPADVDVAPVGGAGSVSTVACSFPPVTACTAYNFGGMSTSPLPRRQARRHRARQGFWRRIPVWPPPPDHPGGVPPSPDYTPPTTDDEAEASGTAGNANSFILDSGLIDFDTAEIIKLADSIDNHDANSELPSVDHFRSG
ncbi:hypothetical protein CYMTET_30026 [Cymbomonas tetramitiformis]|uniref:Uncharacterized protein n=1 Tax=Cymbomonas tetramitiformis TaxID=36881 RepID=A0AAE0FL89_9CHLO|nr:hypothetical protein CYMTET_30026 [Cymbomonas tetramitiformis]